MRAATILIAVLVVLAGVPNARADEGMAVTGGVVQGDVGTHGVLAGDWSMGLSADDMSDLNARYNSFIEAYQERNALTWQRDYGLYGAPWVGAYPNAGNPAAEVYPYSIDNVGSMLGVCESLPSLPQCPALEQMR